MVNARDLSSRPCTVAGSNPAQMPFWGGGQRRFSGEKDPAILYLL